ncbi:MAG: hypothetical protein ACK5D5_08315 [Bacteroidota bacterium]|jgi:hypothetical protein
MQKNISLKAFVFIFLFSFRFFSQTTSPDSFTITGNSSPEKENFFKQSISKSNLETYRLKEKQVVLEFKNGFKCVLFSAKELFLKGMKIDINTYQENFDSKFALPVFEINKDGWITAGFSSKSKDNSK